MSENDNISHGLQQPQDIERAYELQTRDNDGNEASPVASTAERWTRTPRPRGRRAKDPNAVSIQFHCQNLQEMKEMLGAYLVEPTQPADHTTLEFIFPVSAAFMVYLGDYRGGVGTDHLYGSLSKSAISVTDAMSLAAEPRDQIRKQKAVSKTIVEAIQEVDGFRYSFHNNWVSKEDEASRFSYFCNDSTLNKGRAANEGAGKAHKQKRKPVFDCSGLLSVKFSATKQNLEVHYKHIPLHATYLERAPPPRAGSKRKRLMEVFQPEVLAAIRDRAKKPKKPYTRRKKANIFEPGQRPATEPPANVVDPVDPRIREGSSDSLQPLVEFLDSAVTGAEQQIQQEPAPPHAVSEPPSFPAETANQLQHTRQTPQKKSTPKPPIPGTMSGAFEGDSLVLSEGTKQRKRSKKVVKPTEALPGIAAAAAAPLSELEELKQKLLAAEQRIQSLETAKTSPWPPPPPPPASAAYPPPPVGYPYPPYPYPYQHPPPYPYSGPNTPQNGQGQVPATPQTNGGATSPTVQPSTTSASKPDSGSLAVKWTKEGQLTPNDVTEHGKLMKVSRDPVSVWRPYEPPKDK